MHRLNSYLLVLQLFIMLILYSPSLYILSFLYLALPCTHAAAFDPLKYVDPLIGSNNGGNVFSGASLPYGLAKAVADVDGQNTGGFATDGSNVTGFSSVHDSGTGGNPSLGNFPLFPQLCPDDDLNNCAFRIGDRKVPYVEESVVAKPGYFSLQLQNGIKAEMTTAHKTALYKFTFSGNDTSGGGKCKRNGTSSAQHPLIMLDLTDLWQSRQNASVSVDAETARMKGSGTFLPSFGAGYYQLHFCVDFFGVEVYDTGVWVNNRAGTDPKELFVTRGFNLFYLEAGGFARFQPASDDSVTARMGMSFISADQACNNAETEIPDALADFDSLVTKTQDAWREKLSPVSIVPGAVSDELLVTLFSGLYRAHMSPQNYTGENPHWDSGIPYFDSFYW